MKTTMQKISLVAFVKMFGECLVMVIVICDMKMLVKMLAKILFDNFHSVDL